MYHNPVMLSECLDGLNINPDGIYVDVTFGGGGHSKAILNKLSDKGSLIAFDQDEDALNNIPDDDRLIFVQQNFRHLERFLKFHEQYPVDGILGDFGVSSHQFDVGERGFSIRFDGPLDMRMNQQSVLTAAKIINTYSEIELQNVFSKYGEVINSKTLAQTIVAARISKKFETTQQLIKAIGGAVRGKENQYLAQVFQALRIETNDELGALKDFLQQALTSLKPGGRLVVMSYHSLEDRLVKDYMKYGSFDGEQQKDDFGNIYRPFKLITKKPMEAGDEELKINPRSRSAKLRIAEKV
ncbi:MAG: rRNA ((1402)-N(4))-methyltransferase RsmH [Bacteroidota bacterium]|jgi:16S rRNA (cytosine1402-N4)-methyltransferase